jgi:hypothetical protein
MNQALLTSSDGRPQQFKYEIFILSSQWFDPSITFFSDYENFKPQFL